LRILAIRARAAAAVDSPVRVVAALSSTSRPSLPTWRADRGARALKTVSEIEASIASLHDEDLLDLHDIFAGSVSKCVGDNSCGRNATAI
jgi:hypothetical protein